MSYRGLVVPLPVGQQGFSGTENPSQAGPGHLLYTDGVELQAGVVRKEGGALKFNQSAVSSLPDAATKVLLHMNGADASTTFTDSSPVPKTFTANGNAQIDTAQSKFGGASGLFDASGDFISALAHADFAQGSGGWAVDLQVSVSAPTGNFARLAGQWDDGVATNAAWLLLRHSSNVLQATVNVGSISFTILGTTQLTNLINPGFHHVALERDGDVLELRLDGVLEGSVAITGSINTSTADLTVGNYGAFSGNSANSWIDEFRFSSQIRWGADFTPPTSEYPNAGPGGGAGAGEVIISGINWTPTQSNRRDVIFTSAGRVLKDSGAGTFSVTMATGLISVRDPPPWFAVGGGEAVAAPRKLMLFSATNQVQFVDADGAVMAPIGAPAADWTGAGNFPTFGIPHAFRMWAGGNNSDPHRLYYSTTTDHEDFAGAGSGTIAIFPGEGERLAGAVSFRGALVVFKYPHGIYIVNTADPSPANWSVTPLTRAVGTLNQHTIVQVENDILYLDVTGDTHALSTTQEFGDFTTSDIGDADSIHQFMRRYVNVSKLRRAQGIWYGRRQQAWWAMPLLSSDDNNLRFITLIEATTDQREQTVQTRRFFMSRRDVCVSMWLKPDLNEVPTPVIGDASGFIYLMDQDLRSKDGAGYPFTFETANTDFGFYDQELATRMKAGQFLEISFEPRGDWDLTVEAFWDDVLTDTLLFNMGSGGAVLGSFILDTDVLSSSSVRSARTRMAGSGRRLRLVGNNEGAGQDVSLASFYVHMTMMDERING